MLVPANLEFLNELRDSFYICAVPVLLAAVLYFRRLRDGTELKLLFAFWIWFWFSRALNGSPTLDHDFRIFFDLSLMIPFFALGPALTNAEKTFPGLAQCDNRRFLFYHRTDCAVCFSAALFVYAAYCRGPDRYCPERGLLTHNHIGRQSHYYLFLVSDRALSDDLSVLSM